MGNTNECLLGLGVAVTHSKQVTISNDESRSLEWPTYNLGHNPMFREQATPTPGFGTRAELLLVLFFSEGVWRDM